MSVHSRPTSRRSILLVIPLIVVVVMLVGIFGEMLVNSEWFVKYAEKTLSETIGQEVTIGSLSVDFGKTIQVVINDLVVTNPPWAKTPHLAAAAAVAMGIDAVNLLDGNLVMTHLRLDKPNMHLEVSSDGLSNWNTEKRGDRTSTDQEALVNQSEKREGLNLPHVESLEIDEGIVTYFDPIHKARLDLSITSSQIETNKDHQGLLVEGDGQLAGETLSIELMLARPSVFGGGANASYPLSFHVSTTETSLVVEGKIDSPISPEHVDLHVHLDGRNLAYWNKVLGIGLPKLPSFEASGRLHFEDGTWSLDPMRVVALDTDISGTLWLTPHATPPLLEGRLASQRVNLTQLQEFMPEQDQSAPMEVQIGGILAVVAGMPIQAALQWRAERIENEDLIMHDAAVDMQTHENSLEVSSLSGSVNGHPVRLSAVVEIDDEVKNGTASIKLETSHLLTEPSRDGTVQRSDQKRSNEESPDHLQAELVIGFQTTKASDQNPSSNKGEVQDPHDQIGLASVSLRKFHAQYTDSSSKSSVVARLQSDHARTTSKIIANGHYRDTPVEVSLFFPRWESVWNVRRRADLVPMSLDVSLPHATASARFSISPSWPPEKANVRVAIHSDVPDRSGALLGFDLPSIKPLTLHGSVLKEEDMWKILNVESRIGNSHVKGKGVLKMGTRMQVKAHLASSHLDLSEWITVWSEDQGPRSETTLRTRIPGKDRSTNTPRPKTSFAPWLNQIDSHVHITVQKMVLPTLALQKISTDVSIVDAHIKFESLFGDVGNGRIQTVGTLALTNPSPTGRFKVNIEQINLTRLMHTVGNNEMQLGTLSGNIALRLSPGNSVHDASNAEVYETLLERLRIEDVHLRYDDPHLQAQTDLRLMTDSFDSEMKIEGKVEYHDIPVDVSITTGSLHQSIEDYQTLPVDATLKIRETTIGIKGKIGELFPLETLSTSLRLAGPDLFRFGEAIHIPLPHLPPYDLRAHWQRKQLDSGRDISIFENLEGTIGDSDVAGLLRVTTGGEQPVIYTRLESRKLDLDDLGGLIGSQPDPDETASRKQRMEAEKIDQQERLFPNTAIDFSKLQQVDADVEYRATRIQAPNFPLDDFFLKMNLQEGHMSMKRLDFGVATGTVSMTLDVQANGTPVRAKLATDFDQVDVKHFLADNEETDDSYGNIGGRAVLWMQGASLAEWLASADGGLYLTMTGGKLDALMVELAGLDFAESVAVFLNTDQGVEVDCAYADFQARNGLVSISPFLVDTQDTKFKGTGSINLRREQVDLTIKPYPKDFSLLSARGPLEVTGTLIDPDFHLNPTFPTPEFATADDSVRCENLITSLREARKQHSPQLRH